MQPVYSANLADWAGLGDGKHVATQLLITQTCYIGNPYFSEGPQITVAK